MAGILDDYTRVITALREEWPDLFRGYAGKSGTMEEIRFVSERLGLAMIPKADVLLKEATKYLNLEKDPEPVPTVKSTPQVIKTDLPAGAVAGSW